MKEYDVTLDDTKEQKDGPTEEGVQQKEAEPKKMLVEEVALERAHKVKRGRGRPSREGRYQLNVTRETRVPVGGYRDILTLENTDPEFHYYWELDSSETGPNIHKRLRAGYDFVRDDEGVIVGQASVFRSESVGSILRVPNGDGRYMYLLRIPKEWHEEDMERLNQEVNETESSLQGPQFDGTYGRGVSIERR